MAVCAKCKETFSDDFIFCPNCGKQREDKCICGATLSPGMRYCGKCGKITQIEAKRQEEKRRIAEELEELKRLIEEKRRSALEEKEREQRRLAAKVDRGDYIELIHPIGNIRMIEKVCSPNQMTWYDALRYAKNLRKGGFSDWRVPTKEELLEIYEIKDICGNRIFADNCCFWSSSTDVYDTNRAWGVYFDDGGVYIRNKTYDSYVRCVR